MNPKLALVLALVLSGCVLILTGGCATSQSKQTDMEVVELQNRVENLEAVSSALTTELIEKEGKYITRQGDTLALIAKKFNLQVKDIYRMNPGLQSQIPKNWKPGMIIVVREIEPNK